MWFFYFLAALVLAQSAISLRAGVRWLAFFRRELDARRALFLPFASVFVPCRGLDQGLSANLAALFRQHYPAYELVFVSDRADAPALTAAEELSRAFASDSVAHARLVVEGPAQLFGDGERGVVRAV